MPSTSDDKQITPDSWAQMLDDPDTSETGGEETNEGVDFSRYWAMAALLALEESGATDYAFIFEYLQDLTLLNSPTKPITATLYQVKKKEKGVWKRSHLCAPKNASAKTSKEASAKKLKGRSALGKLYLSLEQASKHVKQSEGVFVSNACCDLKSTSGVAVPAYCRVRLASLHKEDADYIETKLARELNQKKPLPKMNALSVEQTRVAPAAMRETVQGMAGDYLEKHHPTIPMLPGRLVERLLQSFTAVSGRHGGMKNLAEIIQKKGFTRQQFTAVLAELSKHRTAASMLDAALADLKDSGVGARTAERIHAEAMRVRIEMMRDPAVQQTLRWELAVSTASANRHLESYSPIVAAVVTAVEQKLRDERGFVPELDTLRALAILAINYVDEELASSNTKPQNETK